MSDFLETSSAGFLVQPECNECGVQMAGKKPSLASEYICFQVSRVSKDLNAAS